MVSRATVTQSYEQLLSEGYLRAAIGSGTFVGCQLPDELLRTRPVETSRPATRRQEANHQIELSRYGASITDLIPFEPPEPELPINFKTGRPALDEFPLQQWRRLMLKYYRANDLSLLDYANGSLVDYPDCSLGGAEGYEPVREAIAGHPPRAIGRGRPGQRAALLPGRTPPG